MSVVDQVDEVVCKELVELVTDYLEAELDDATRDRVEAHLAGCPHCSAYVEQMRVTTRALRETRTAELSGPRKQELIEAFRGWAADRPG
jgi:anti-sigma factor RsiW